MNTGLNLGFWKVIIDFYTYDNKNSNLPVICLLGGVLWAEKKMKLFMKMKI